MDARNGRNFLSARYWSCYAFCNVLVLSVLCLILFKALRLQVWEHQVWLQRERAQMETTFQVPTYRGSIYDRQGRLLAYSVPQHSLYADCEMVENSAQLATRLAPILGEPKATLEKRLASGRKFVWLKRHLTDQQALAVEKLRARGLNLIQEYRRFYPHRQIAGHVVGFVGRDGTGLEGIEKSFDRVLRQSTTTFSQHRDGVRKYLWLNADPPPEIKENFGVTLTIDAYLQYLCESELEKCVRKYRAASGEVVVMDPDTFEILAMANWPSFDPNLEGKKNAEIWRNRSITDFFEPGSTFKVFLVSAALEEGSVREKDRVFCENGKCVLAGHMVNDVHPYGWLTIPEVIKYSSNIAAGKLALQLGGERYHRHIKGFGFGSRTGVELPGEARGLVRSWKKWRPIDLATTGFGQSIGVTALQLTAGIGCIANGGEWKQSRVVLGIVDSDSRPTEPLRTKPTRRTIQSKTAQQIRDMMQSVTQEGGTGVNAAPEGYSAAGKTGTAQMLDPATKRYASNKYTSLFTGFVPAEKPRLVISVVIHEPHGAIYGGVVAAPVFKNVAAKALPYLGVSPSPGRTGNGPKLKLVNAPKKESTKSPPAVENAASSKMPDVSGLSLQEALQRLAPLDAQVKLRGRGTVVSQSPEVGTPLKSKGTVELVLNDVRETGTR